MNEPRPDPEGRDRDDEAFVRRIAESYRPPEPTPSQRVAFRAGLDARLERRPGRLVWAAAAVSLAAALTFALLRAPWGGVAPSEAPRIAETEGGAPSGEAADVNLSETLLALALPDDDDDASLPEDYQAIADFFLEGV